MSRFGIAVVAAVTAVAAAGMLAVFLWRGHADAEAVTADEPPPTAAAPATVEVPAPVSAPRPAIERATPLVERLIGEPGPDEGLEGELLALGDEAVAALLRRLGGGVGGAARERLVGLLRRLPGPAAEAGLIAEARGGPQPSTRTMAMDALAERKSARSLEALSSIARSDPELPARPLIAEPRSPDDLSTELPDEQTFTPRMQAMAALAATGDSRAVAVLAETARLGPDEALRMEAARHLANFRDDPRAAEGLRAATADPSAYVRLSALHSLAGSTSPELPALLARIAAQDPDAGVRALAQRIMEGQRR